MIGQLLGLGIGLGGGLLANKVVDSALAKVIEPFVHVPTTTKIVVPRVQPKPSTGDDYIDMLEKGPDR